MYKKDAQRGGIAAIQAFGNLLDYDPHSHLLVTWGVDALPSDLPEDTLPTHDYVSIAVEFEDGQDLTYYWSAKLPPGTI